MNKIKILLAVVAISYSFSSCIVVSPGRPPGKPYGRGHTYHHYHKQCGNYPNKLQR